MYFEYFGLSEAPFSITPDPAFVFLSQRHRDALAHLQYGVGQGGSGGFVQLTGEVGTGKTTLCRCLLEQVPEDTRIALVLNPLLTPVELLAAICEELGIETSGIEDSSKALVDRLNHYLLTAHQEGKRVVVIIDEAQILSPESLEQVRLLTNLETSKQKLLQIILLGQPELRELLQRRSLRQLAQRITARYHLTPLGPADTASYVQHRMQVASAVRSPFRKSALKALYQRSNGVPRLINIIADRALVGAYAGEVRDIGAKLIHAAADEVQLGEPGAGRSRRRFLIAAIAGLLLALITWNVMRPEILPDPITTTVTGSPAPVQPFELTEPETTEPEATPMAEVNEAASAPATVFPDAEWLGVQNQAAWQGMATLWNESDGAYAIQTACRGESPTDWACLKSEGSFARITKLGLPVVLQLQGDAPGLLLLQGVDENRLLAGAPGNTRILSRQEIETRWLGSYTVAWPQSASWPKEIKRGDTGPAVDTVLRLAALADPAYSGSAEFELDFQRWLVDFQIANGLDSDGIVGPRTLLYLIGPSISEPRLKTDWTTKD